MLYKGKVDHTHFMVLTDTYTLHSFHAFPFPSHSSYEGGVSEEEEDSPSSLRDTSFANDRVETLDPRMPGEGYDLCAAEACAVVRTF